MPDTPVPARSVPDRSVPDLHVLVNSRTGRLRHTSDFPALRSALFARAAETDAFELAHHVLYQGHTVRPTPADLAWLVEEASDATWSALNAAVSRNARFAGAPSVWLALARKDEPDFHAWHALWGGVPLDPYLATRYVSDQPYVSDYKDRTEADSQSDIFRKTATMAGLADWGARFNRESTDSKWFNVDLRALDADLLAPVQSDGLEVRSLTRAEFADEIAGPALGGAGAFMPKHKKFGKYESPFGKLCDGAPAYLLRVARPGAAVPYGYQFLDEFYRRVFYLSVDSRPDGRRAKRAAGSKLGYHLRRRVGSLLEELATPAVSTGSDPDHPF